MGRNKKKSGGGGNRNSGRGRGRGGGGRGNGNTQNAQGRGAGRMVHQGPPQCRLFYLYQHLVLNCFNYLDDEGRTHAFTVMGWNYENRKEMFRKKQEEIAKMKARKEEEEKLESAKKGQDAENISEDLNNLSVSGNTDGNKTGKSGSYANSSNNASKQVLLPLFGRTDPDTLLARLNTRRLHQRLVHHKKEQRKKQELKTINNDEKEGAPTSAPNGDVKSGQSIMEFYENELKEKMQADRLYPKHVTVEEMAELEWNNLLEMASLRWA